jgi:hypothetical protein
MGIIFFIPSGMIYSQKCKFDSNDLKDRVAIIIGMKYEKENRLNTTANSKAFYDVIAKDNTLYQILYCNNPTYGELSEIANLIKDKKILFFFSGHGVYQEEEETKRKSTHIELDKEKVSINEIAKIFNKNPSLFIIDVCRSENDTVNQGKESNGKITSEESTSLNGYSKVLFSAPQGQYTKQPSDGSNFFTKKIIELLRICNSEYCVTKNGQSYINYNSVFINKLREEYKEDDPLPHEDQKGHQPLVKGENDFIIITYKSSNNAKLDEFYLCKDNSCIKGDITQPNTNNSKGGEIKLIIPFQNFFYNKNFTIKSVPSTINFNGSSIDTLTPKLIKNDLVTVTSEDRDRQNTLNYNINYEADYSWECFVPIYGYCYSKKDKGELSIIYSAFSLISLASVYYFNTQYSYYKNKLKESENLMVASYVTNNNLLLYSNSDLHSKFEKLSSESFNISHNSKMTFLAIFLIGSFHSLFIIEKDPWCYPFCFSLNIDKKPTPDPNRRMEDNYEISFKANF